MLEIDPKGGSEEDIENKEEGLWSDKIPAEILLNIFKTGAKQYGPVPFLCRTAQVCRRWYQLSYQLSLWSSADLSVGWITRDLSGLRMLCATRLQRTTSLNLTAWFNMTDKHLQCILEYCKCLHVLKLAHCAKLTCAGMICLLESQVKLEELDLSFTSPAISSYRCLQKVLPFLGRTLKKLHLSNVYTDNNFHIVLHCLALYCRHLTYLDISHIASSYVTVNIEEMQYGCPDLEILLMAKSLFKAKPVPEEVKVMSPGFPKLKIFSAPEQVNNDFLQRTLKASYDLDTLKMNLKQTENVNYSMLPMARLRKLVIHSARPQEVHIKWHFSLVYLDMSWIPSAYTSREVDAMMQRVFQKAGPPFVVLSSLVLCGCPMTAYGIRPVFECCPKLKLLNVNFCPNLPHGWSREYEGTDLEIFKHVLTR